MSGPAIHELRDGEEARHILLQSFLLQRLQPPQQANLSSALAQAIDLAGAGSPLPPLGVLADLENLLLKPHASSLSRGTPVPGWSDHLALAYEDLVLGKWLADTSLERAGDALRSYQGDDRARGLTFIYNQLRARCGYGGLLLSPAFLKKLRDQPAEQVIAAAWDSVEQFGLLPLLPILFEDLETQTRRATSMLGPEDIFELEHRTALAEFSQRVALRQVLQATAALSGSLPAGRPPQSLSPREVPSHLRDEDTYPVGGFTSLSNRGTVESLLHSQLAFMEEDQDDGPDLFDIKFLRDELLYYSRDENQFFRRRRTFVFVLFPDLVHARVKSAASAWQDVIVLLALIIALTERLTEWLGNDSLVFEILFPHAEDGFAPLDAEQRLLEVVLRKQIANKTVRVEGIAPWTLAARCEAHTRKSLVDGLFAGTTGIPVDVDRMDAGMFQVVGSRPVLQFGEERLVTDAESSLESWCQAFARLMERWIR